MNPMTAEPTDVGVKPDVMIKDAPEKEEKGEKSIDEVIKEAKKRYDHAVEVDRKNREKSLDDLKFLAGDQWPDDVKIRRAGRLMLTLNRMPGFVDNVTGDIRQNKPSIKCRPANDSATSIGAKAMDGIVRNVEYLSQAENAYIGAADMAASCGFGAFRVNIEYARSDTFDREIKIIPIDNPFTLVIDPLSVRSDGSDAKYMFVSEYMDADEFEEKYPNAIGSNSFSEPKGTAKEPDKYEDPRQLVEYWREEEGEEEELLLLTNGEEVFKNDLTDDQRNRYAMMGVYPSKSRKTRKKKIIWMRLSGDECLEGPLEWEGSYIPIILTYGKLSFADGKKSYHGIIRWAKDAQMLYNFYKTTQAETLALQPKAPFILTAAQVEGREQEWWDANNDTRPYLVFNPDPNHPGIPQRSQPPMGSPALFNEGMAAVDEMKALTGIFDASMGNKSNETSGRAILARQQQGDLANFSIKDNLRRAVEHCGRVIVDLIPEVYRNRQYLRILGQEGEGDLLKIGGEKGFDLTTGKYDVVATMGPSYASTRLENQDLMRELIQSIPAIGPMVADQVIEQMDFPSAQAMADRVKQLNPTLAPLRQPPPPVQQSLPRMPAGISPQEAPAPQPMEGISQ